MVGNRSRVTQVGVRRRVELDPGNVWRIGLVVVGLLVLVVVVRFVLDHGSSLLFTAVMAWFFSLAMEPAVSRLSQHMRRGAATGLVMLGVVVFLVLFFGLFGQLVVEQVANLVRSVPDLVENGLAWVNRTFGTEYELRALMSSIDLSPERAAGVASDLAGGVLAILGSVAGAVATFFTFALLLFYLSADGPRLRRWIASLFPPAAQRTTLVVWDTTAEKTGRYVAARVLLAAVNSTASGIVFLVIGLPSWLALALWTGLVAQFVPAIGTYISIVLPVLVGLLSPNPWLGVIVLAWGIVYQQIENLTIEPRISARAVNIHPAVSFASVILGVSMFGVAGALLAIPVVAMLLSLLNLYRTRYELLPELQAEAGSDERARAEDDETADDDRVDDAQAGATAT
ncbi:AI-2E family transporter [Actinotalea sp. Marseille-Q4924]|uniref:AI-2E family transporter n=1 Tax=Actinotalea sp. Marseille-Q4924 TaxID=2866571 RepID=UPI001CE3F124|nr:AI-2E family transporter [Actinotalea sp. Marseille-Q4924]